MDKTKTQTDVQEISEEKVTQYLTFILEDEQYAVNVLYVWKVLAYTQITKMPNTPDHVRGVINLHGSVVPVMDLRKKFGMSQTEKTIDTSIIAMELEMEDKKLPVAVLADAVKEVIDINEDDIEPPPKVGTHIDNSLMQGIGKKDEEFVIILDIEKVFSLEELQAGGNADSTESE